MRFKTVLSVAALAIAIGFAPAAQAASKNSESGQSSTWSKADRGQQTNNEAGVTVREVPYQGQPAPTQGQAFVRIQPMRPATEVPPISVGRGPANLHYQTGAFTYVFTGPNGKYSYFLDHYDYPYRFGQEPTLPPPGVYGYVPPQQAGGGPALYYRGPRLSWTIPQEMGSLPMK